MKPAAIYARKYAVKRRAAAKTLTVVEVDAPEKPKTSVVCLEDEWSEVIAALHFTFQMGALVEITKAQDFLNRLSFAYFGKVKKSA